MTSPHLIIPPTQYTVEDTTNGYLLTVTTYSLHNLHGVVGSTDKEHFEEFADVLSTLSDIIDPGSRHDATRTYIVQAPGDKHEAWTDSHSEVIYGAL